MMTRPFIRFSTWIARRRARLDAQSVREEIPEADIGAEAPIRSASEDRLRRSDFADRIASVLSEISLREGRVFAIRGGWGFGKSSLKYLIAERLDAMEKGADWLDFNPWQWNDSDSIVRALFGQIADRLGGAHSEAAIDRAESLRRYGAILTGAGAPIKKAGDSNSLISTMLTNASVVAIASAIGFNLPTAAKFAAGLAILSVAATSLGRIMSYFGRDITGEPLSKVRKSLEARLRELDRPLVVFVDDIDRLEPEQIRMLLRQVKVNANLPNIVFVLLFQPSIVEQALAPVADGNGRAFLEKIVQASFDLPAVPSSTVHRIFTEELSGLVGPYANEANGFSQTRWGNAFVGCIQPMLRNLRDARRLISSISVHIPLHAADDLFEVNIVDFLVLETLRVFEPGLHEALFREKDLLLQTQRLSSNAQRDEDRAAAERLRDIVPEGRRAVAQETIRFLFPGLEWAYGGTNYADDFQETWHTAKRVCAARYFPRYFELQTAAGEISERGFIAFIRATESSDDLTVAVEDAEVNGLLPSLVARLDETTDRLPTENASVLLPAMFMIAQKFAGTGNAGPFSSPWISAWRATSRFLRRLPTAERGELMLNAFRQTEALSITSILIHLSDPTDRREEDDGIFDPALNLDTVMALKAEWLRLIRARASDGSKLISDPDLLSLLYRWGDYSGSLDEPREWVTEATRTDEGFAIIASRLISVGTSHSSGDRVSTQLRRFNRETIEDLIGVAIAKTRCDSIDPVNFPGHEEALRILKRSVDLWLGLRERDTHDF